MISKLCQDCGLTEKKHKTNPWIGMPGHCEKFSPKEDKKIVTELKTLKDLDLCCVSKGKDDTKCLFPQIELKAEAIKRWKSYKIQRDKITNVELLDTMKAIKYNRFDAKMEEIEEFNNLTEEDLK